MKLVDKKITIIGGGTIGASWAALCLANGMIVTLSDPAENVKEKVEEFIFRAKSSLINLGYSDFNTKKLFFESDLQKAVSQAEIIQENGPEKLDFKVELWEKIEASAPNKALFLSSSSGISATKQSVRLKVPGRLIIGHPFNPPHLMPLVEVVPGEHTPEELVSDALSFYKSLGKSPVVIRKEVSGFVANRLQSAMFRECLSLVKEKVISVSDLDKIVTTSLGIRWMVNGPFLAFHLGGGEGGFTHFCTQFSSIMESSWEEQSSRKIEFNEDLINKVSAQIGEAYGKSSISQLAEARDSTEVKLIRSIGNSNDSSLA